jgi:hypothetical protein
MGASWKMLTSRRDRIAGPRGLAAEFRASPTAGLRPALMPRGGGAAILPAPVPRKPRTKGAKVIKVREGAAFGLGSSKASPLQVRGLVKRYGHAVRVPLLYSLPQLLAAWVLFWRRDVAS